MTREGGNVTAIAEGIDAQAYARLLARALPKRIETEGENERALAVVREIMRKGEGNETPEEGALLDLLFPLIQAFEEDAYPIPDAAPHQVIAHLLEAKGLPASALLPIFGSRGHVSDVLHGRRGITAAKAKALGEFFHVSAEVFI